MAGNLCLLAHEAVSDHQRHKYYTGEIVIDKSDARHKKPWQVLSQITYRQKGGSPVLLFYPEPHGVQEGGNPCPPDQRVSECTDALPEIAAGIGITRKVPDGTYDQRPLIPWGGI